MYSDSYVINNPSLYGPLAGPGLAGKQRYRQDSLTLVNARFTWSDAKERYLITVYGNNLTDKEYRKTYSGGAFGDYSTKAAPITYDVELGYQF